MPATLTALIVALLALLPGALYTWAFEQEAGRWGSTAADRLQRFFGASAIFGAVELPVMYELYRRLVVSGDLAAGRPLPSWAWLLPVGLAGLPILLGRLVGRAAYKRRPWVRLFTGPAPAPRAWDELFARADLTGWLVLKLKNGTWRAGYWGESPATSLRSYAAGYPEAQDLLLAETANIDVEGNLLLDDDGQPRVTGVAALVRWDEVDYARFARD